MRNTIYKVMVPFLGAAALVQADEWAGVISTPNVLVNVGEIPDIQWNVTYPVSSVEDVIDIDDGEITPRRVLYMQVRLLGASWGDVDTFYTVNGRLHINSESTRLFLGTHDEIDQAAVVYEDFVLPGDVIRTSASGHHAGLGWGSVFRSWDNTPNVVLLKNGDDAPQLAPGYAIQQGVEDHLAPYMDMATGKMAIGPRDIVYLFDFNNVGSPGYDLQDFCVIITLLDAEYEDIPVADDDDDVGNGPGDDDSGGIKKKKRKVVDTSGSEGF